MKLCEAVRLSWPVLLHCYRMPLRVSPRRLWNEPRSCFQMASSFTLSSLSMHKDQRKSTGRATMAGPVKIHAQGNVQATWYERYKTHHESICLYVVVSMFEHVWFPWWWFEYVWIVLRCMSERCRAQACESLHKTGARSSSGKVGRRKPAVLSKIMWQILQCSTEMHGVHIYICNHIYIQIMNDYEWLWIIMKWIILNDCEWLGTRGTCNGSSSQWIAQNTFGRSHLGIVPV